MNFILNTKTKQTFIVISFEQFLYLKQKNYFVLSYTNLQQFEANLLYNISDLLQDFTVLFDFVNVFANFHRVGIWFNVFTISACIHFCKLGTEI